MVNSSILLTLTVPSLLSLLVATADEDVQSTSTSIPTFFSTYVQTWEAVANDGDDDHTPSPTPFVTSVSTSFHTLLQEEDDDDDEGIVTENDVGAYLVGGGTFFFSHQSQEPNTRRPRSREPSPSPTTVTPSMVPSESPAPFENGDRNVSAAAAAAAFLDEEVEVDEEATKEEKTEDISTHGEVENLVVSLDDEKNDADNNTKKSDRMVPTSQGMLCQEQSIT